MSVHWVKNGVVISWRCTSCLKLAIKSFALIHKKKNVIKEETLWWVFIFCFIKPIRRTVKPPKPISEKKATMWVISVVSLTYRAQKEMCDFNLYKKQTMQWSWLTSKSALLSNIQIYFSPFVDIFFPLSFLFTFTDVRGSGSQYIFWGNFFLFVCCSKVWYILHKCHLLKQIMWTSLHIITWYWMLTVPEVPLF